MRNEQKAQEAEPGHIYHHRTATSWQLVIRIRDCRFGEFRNMALCSVLLENLAPLQSLQQPGCFRLSTGQGKHRLTESDAGSGIPELAKGVTTGVPGLCPPKRLTHERSHGSRLLEYLDGATRYRFQYRDDLRGVFRCTLLQCADDQKRLRDW